MEWPAAADLQCDYQCHKETSSNLKKVKVKFDPWAISRTNQKDRLITHNSSWLEEELWGEQHLQIRPCEAVAIILYQNVFFFFFFFSTLTCLSYISLSLSLFPKEDYFK